MDKKPATLSGGQKQRVALGRAIIREPEVFLFDEPLSNIDAKLRMKTRIELIKLHKQLGTTFVYVTHDQTEAMTMADRIVVIKDGVIQQIDTPDNLYNNPNNIFTASFIGTPQMNFFEGKLNDSSLSINVDDKCYKLNTHGVQDLQEVVIGVRPEKVEIYDNLKKYNKQDNIVLSNCEIEAVELLGSEKLVYFTYKKLNIVSKISANIEINKDNKFDICFKISDLHIFNRQTERKINI